MNAHNPHQPPTATQDGDRFWKLPECYVRGNSIKYLRVPEEVIDMVNEEDLEKERTLELLFVVWVWGGLVCVGCVGFIY